MTTFATVSSELCHVTVLSVVFSGSIVATRFKLSPILRVASVLFKVILVAGTVGFPTVTVQVAILPLLVVTIIVVVPAPTATTTPSFTVATDVLEEIQVTLLSVTLEGVNVVVRVELSPTIKLNEVVLRETPVA